MPKFTWPTKVWMPGEFKDDKQLWYSRIVTREDRKRRLDYEDRFIRRTEHEHWRA